MTKTIKKCAAISLIVSVLLLSSIRPAAAAQDAMKNTVTSALYGGLLGTLLGASVQLLSDKPSDHYDYLWKGAALGVIGGTIYGLATSAPIRSLGEIENGKFSWNFPTVVTASSRDRMTNRTEVVEHMGILKVKY